MKLGSATLAQDGSESLTRYERRRQRTRAKLIAAAHEVMARKGVEAATIAEITSVAGVGFGSFHNHFGSKDEIARAVFGARTERIGQISDFICDTYPHYVQAIAFIGRVYIEMAHADPVWAWFVLNAQSSLQLMDDILGTRARKHLRQGVEEGALEVTDPDLIGACAGVGSAHARLFRPRHSCGVEKAASLKRFEDGRGRDRRRQRC